MHIKMMTVECGPNGNFHPGDVREVSDEHGQALIASRHAIAISPRVRETAAFVPREAAVMPEPVKRKSAKVK